MKNEKCLKTTSKKVLHRFMALVAVLIAVCLVFMAPVSAESTWSGSSDIATGTHLAYLAQQVNAGTDYSSKLFKLTDDTNLNNEEWTPIGCDQDNTFKGTFDGNSKTISGLNITSNTLIAVGLFGYSEGTVNNLSVTGIIDISLTKNTNEDYLSAGSIVGTNSGATISNNYADVNIEADSETSAYIGCIAGESLGESKNLNCYVAWQVMLQEQHLLFTLVVLLDGLLEEQKYLTVMPLEISL